MPQLIGFEPCPSFLSPLAGFQIIEDAHLVKSELVKRTWKERFFTRPWRPFKKYREVFYPSEEILTIGRTLIMHPMMKQKILREMGTK